ncbi:ABC transporter permease [Gorillibacterium massiliense]|uniref:ABC transporter permease n=1 Tax=Gorillibacterium massiliense TaxID=1280390 RepID=UPI0004BBD5A9|nr:ABC-2 family transporter protein [Gorillibacterium massiliense]
MRVSGVKKYVTIANRSMQNTFSYRLAYFMNMLNAFVGLFSMYFLWKAIYGGRDVLAGYTWDQMKAYIVITFLANSLLSINSEFKISRDILDGGVAMDLIKPVDYQKARLSETLGSCLVEGLFSALFVSLLLIATVGIMVPDRLATWLLFVVSLALSILVKFGVVYLTGLLCFWTTGSVGLVWARAAITNLLSGALVPLSFFPHWLEKLAMVLPFQSIIYTPTRIYMNGLSASEALQMIGIQLFWAVVLWFAGKFLWTHAIKKITIHGG